MVNVAYPGVNLSLPGWTLIFTHSGTKYNSTLTLQWNQWRTNYWFTYAIVLTSNIGYTVTVYQPSLGTWKTVQGSITPSGQNLDQNFLTTGNSY